MRSFCHGPLRFLVTYSLIIGLCERYLSSSISLVTMALYQSRLAPENWRDLPLLLYNLHLCRLHLEDSGNIPKREIVERVFYFFFKEGGWFMLREQ